MTSQTNPRGADAPSNEREAYEKWMNDNYLTEFPGPNPDAKVEPSFAWRAWLARAALSRPT